MSDKYIRIILVVVVLTGIVIFTIAWQPQPQLIGISRLPSGFYNS